MKYPAIYKSEDGSTYLHASKLLFSHLVNGKAYEWRNLDGGDEQEKDTNITAEYLSNTWGVVESKEHAEFIIELAELHGFNIVGGDRLAIKYFCTNKDSLVFCAIKSNARRDRKQITIPLPPKAKEWPQVGDKVVTRGGSKGVLLIANADKDGMVVCDFDGEYALAYLNELQKPKSKQDLLIEGLQTKLCNNNAVDNYILACDIINGEIEGLSYEV